MRESLMKISDCIKNIRFNMGITQTELASRIDKDKASISLYESGQRKPGFPTIKRLIDLANANGMNLKFTDLRDDL